MTTRVALTYRDYAALPDDGKRYEVHDGELWEMTAPSTLHQIILMNLAQMLSVHVTAGRLGLVMVSPLDVILAEGPKATVLQPDVVFLDAARLEGGLRMRGVDGPPTLAVEILSPSTAAVDRTRKRELYARFEVRYLWFLDPEARAIEAHVLERGDYRLARRASGPEPLDLPPFTDLALVLPSLWPTFPIRP
jgi:Uma2 family endonuclease